MRLFFLPRLCPLCSVARLSLVQVTMNTQFSKPLFYSDPQALIPTCIGFFSKREFFSEVSIIPSWNFPLINQASSPQEYLNNKTQSFVLFRFLHWKASYLTHKLVNTNRHLGLRKLWIIYPIPVPSIRKFFFKLHIYVSLH